MRSYRFFSEEEFQRCTPPCSLDDMEDWFMQMLDRARECAGVPFRITSAYRSEEYERAHGRSGNSAHTWSCAVDIACSTSRERYYILSALFKVGFSRIGIAPTFIHVDTSLKHDDNVVWLYEQK